MVKKISLRRHKEYFFDFLIHLHGIAELLGRAILFTFTRPYYFRDTIEQMYDIGVRSLIIVVMTTAFTGLVLALQSGYELAIYGAKMYVGTLLSVSLVRELGPVLVSLVVAGRVGAGIAAELGSMAVTEQIDAMRALGTNPIKKLVTTRLFALMIMLPFLTILGDMVGILGGLLIATTELGISSSFYWTTVIRSLMFQDFILGTVKPFVFAIAIALVSCYLGIKATGGTKGVGEATTRAVVYSSILIFVLNFFITNLVISLKF